MRRAISPGDAAKATGGSLPADQRLKGLPLVAIADKNQIVRDGLVEIIIRDGRFNPVVAVATGGEFLKGADTKPIAIGIIGWSFPDMTGRELLVELKRRKSKIRVIVYSGEARDRVLREAIPLGAWGFASKRTEPAHLLDIIATVAAGRLSLPYVDLTTSAQNPLSSLTERERGLLSALANGWSNQQIADHFGITRNTVKYHLKNLYDKLDVDNRTMAIALLRADQSGER